MRQSIILLLIAAVVPASVTGLVPTTEAATAAAASDIVFADGFESGDLGAWDNVATNRYAVTDDPAHVKTGSYALEGTIPAGDGWGELNKWFLPGYDEIYVRFDVMFEDGFVNLRGDGNGMHFASVSGNRIDNKWSAHGKAGIVPDGTDFFTTTVDPEHSYNDPAPGPLNFYTYYPDMSCCYGNLFQQSEPKAPLVTGRWHEIIIHVDAGTPGIADGSQALWIDGVKRIEVQNLRWRDTDDLRLNEFAIVDYMPGSPRDQRIWFDNIVVTTAFPDPVPVTRFADVPRGRLFFAEVEWLAGAGITRGCNPPTNDRFCPDDPVTRGQMAAFLTRALTLPAGTPGRFTDDDTSGFETEIEALAAAGITRGCNPPTNDRFCPDDPVTRAQMAAFLHRGLNR